MVNLFLDQSHHGNLDQSQQVDLEQSIRYRAKRNKAQQIFCIILLTK